MQTQIIDTLNRAAAAIREARLGATWCHAQDRSADAMTLADLADSTESAAIEARRSAQYAEMLVTNDESESAIEMAEADAAADEEALVAWLDALIYQTGMLYGCSEELAA